MALLRACAYEPTLGTNSLINLMSVFNVILPSTVRVRLLSVAGVAACLVACLAFHMPIANAQGLKLGGESEDEPAPKLDLGAKKPAPVVKPAQASAPKNNASGTAKYGAWEVACAQAGDNCAMAQIGNDSSGTPVLEMVVRKLQEPLEAEGRTATAVLDIITPLGVVLTSGLSMSIDGGRSEAAPFQICTEQGCLVREPVDDELIGRLKAGGNAKVTVVAANQGEVSSTISLTGFTKAFNSLR